MAVMGLRADDFGSPARRRWDRRPSREAAPPLEPSRPADPPPDLAPATPRFRADLTRLHLLADPAPVSAEPTLLAALIAAVRAGDLERARTAAEALDPAAPAPPPRAGEAVYDTLAHYFDDEARPA